MRVAIVGAGTAGLGCAHFLQGRAEVTVFEAAPRVGGHVHAVGGVEVGFLAFHRTRYPTLSALLDQFGLATAPSPTGLHLRDDAAGVDRPHGLEALDPAVRGGYARLLAMIARHERTGAAYPNVPVGELVDAALARHVVVPAIAALWGFQPAEVLAMSAATVLTMLARFAGATHDQPFERIAPTTDAWLTALLGSLTAEIRTGVRIASVTPDGRVDGEPFDHVVLAVHADQALALLTDPTPAQREVLGAIPYRQTAVWLHDDPVVGARAPYTYHLYADGIAWTTWDMGAIQGTPGYVTVGPPDRPHEPPFRGVRHHARYAHPAFTPAAYAARARLAELDTPVLRFAGSYFGETGSNECALAAGRAAARRLLGDDG